MTNYKHQYEQMKLMVDKYQNEIVPGLRKLIAEREPVRHGRWKVDSRTGMSFCSECWNYAVEADTNYCPCCGAKMDGGADE